jgi:RND family efflux transporter MFP subunit
VVAPVAFIEIKASDLIPAQTQTLVQSLPISGNLKALNTVVIKARVAGEILTLNGREGDSVKAGQLLVRIDPVEYQRRLQQAEQQASAAKTQIDIAKRQYDNNKALVDQGFISKTALDASSATLAGAEATYNAALSGADVARKILSDAVLTSPISGQISSRLAQPGERVSVDARLLEIVDLGTLELEAMLSPADSVDVRVGQEALLNMEGRDEPLKAVVKRINPNVQSNSRSVLVYLALQSTNGLRQGMYGQGELKLKQTQALAVPLAAVRTDKPQPYVQLLDNNKVVHQAVSTGVRGRLLDQAQGAMWVEVQGLSANSQVLPASVGALREGMAVRLADPAPVNTPKP